MQRTKRTKKTTLRSDRRSLLKKYLTGPTLLEMFGYACRLRRSMQHPLVCWFNNASPEEVICLAVLGQNLARVVFPLI
jgi:hypothetical protein